MGNDINTQIRIPYNLNQYLQNEADRIGIAKNALLIILCELGGKVWEENKNPATQSDRWEP